MPKIDASGYRYAIAASRFNKELVDALVRDAVETLHGCGVNAENVRLVRVPGAAELPHVCNMLAQTEQYDAIIALGVVIRGETPTTKLSPTAPQPPSKTWRSRQLFR